MSNRIKILRKNRHITLETLAELCGTSLRMIQYLEGGQRQLTQKWMERIAPHLGVQPYELIKDIGDENKVIDDEFINFMRTVDKSLRDEIISLVKKL